METPAPNSLAFPRESPEGEHEGPGQRPLSFHSPFSQRFGFLGSRCWTSGLSREVPGEGRVKLKAIPWGGDTPSSSSTETINDGQFHTVELVTFDQMVNLSIDGGSPMTMDNFGKHYTLNSDTPLYVGGEDLQAWLELQPALPRPPHCVMVIPGGASLALWPEACQDQDCPVGDIPRWQWGWGGPSERPSSRWIVLLAWSPLCSLPTPD